MQALNVNQSDREGFSRGSNVHGRPILDKFAVVEHMPGIIGAVQDAPWSPKTMHSRQYGIDREIVLTRVTLLQANIDAIGGNKHGV